ncbi:MAG: O-antigen ligase family protein [Burkholderiales bacterium]
MALLNASGWIAALFVASSLFAHDVALRLVLLAGATLLCGVALARAPKPLAALPPIWRPWLVWATWAALSLAWSIEPARSLKEWTNEVLYAALALLVCHIAGQAREAPRAFLSALALGAALACLSALWAFGSGVEVESALGWHGGPGDHSAALLTLMPCAIALLWYARQAQWPRAASVAIAMFIALFVASAYATQNRTIWLAFALEVAGFAAMLAFRRSGEPRAQLLISLAALAVVGASATMTFRVQAEREATGAHSMTADPRLSIWPKAFEYVERRPLVGYGFGRGLLRERLPDEANHGLAWHAHNLFIDLALQTGLVGLLVFIALLAATFGQGLRFAADTSPATAACGMALVGVLIGMVTRNMTDVLLVRQNALLFWSVTGVLLAWGVRWRAGNHGPAP